MSTTTAHKVSIEPRLAMLTDSRQPGYSLQQPFYTSAEIYRLDLQRFWGQQWIWVGHRSQIPNNGDYFLFEFGDESVILVRDKEQIRAHLNVCRHRGSRVCLQSSGNARSFSCPYHAWTYNTDGTLRGGRQMPDDFDATQFGLLPVHLLDFQGLLFVSLAAEPPPIHGNLEKLAPLTQPFALDDLRIVHQASYPVEANWKLALENYLECYHCAPAHREYSKSHSLKDPDSMTQELVSSMQEKSLAAGLPIDELSLCGSDVSTPGCEVYYRRYPLYPGYLTGSESGEPLAPLLGNLSGFDGGATDIQIGVLNSFLAYSDHVVGYRFIPRGLQQTDIQTVWMVRGDAEPVRDYNLDALTWLWHVTTLDDERIIRHNQAGVNSDHYQPGPLSTMEWGIVDFHHTYLTALNSPRD
jgi:Rieske 2Fe-2S family protein